MATTMQQPKSSSSPLTILLVSACAVAIFLTMALNAQPAEVKMISWAGAGLFSCFVVAALPRLFRRKSKALKQVYSSGSKDEGEGASAVLSEQEIADRVPVWEAIAELWLDIEMKPGELKYIAQRLAQSKYSLAELEGILLYEVAPVVHLNLRDTEGEQHSFPIEWLQAEILKHLEKAGSHRTTPEEEAYLTEYVADYWETVKEFTHEYWRLGV